MRIMGYFIIYILWVFNFRKIWTCISVPDNKLEFTIVGLYDNEYFELIQDSKITQVNILEKLGDAIEQILEQM